MHDHTPWNETLIEKTVTYPIEIDGRLLLVENVPARVNVETGERYFASETVERLQQAALEQRPPRAHHPDPGLRVRFPALKDWAASLHPTFSPVRSQPPTMSAPLLDHTPFKFTLGNVEHIC